MMKKVFSIVAGLCLVAGLAVFVPQVKAASNGMGGCVHLDCKGVTYCDSSLADTQNALDYLDSHCP
jgi:hypothetical protein